MGGGAFSMGAGKAGQGEGGSTRCRAMDSKFLPSWPQISRELIAVLIATLGAAWLISRVPEWRELVRQNSLTG